MTDVDYGPLVRELLSKVKVMALSTSGRNGSWVAPVGFNYTNELELEFMSMPETVHVQNILNNSQVSVAIFLHTDDVSLGLQISGIAKSVNDNLKPKSWNRFTITPSEVWAFDSRIERKRHKISISSLNLT